jgi:uncharacterized membrane protein (UPF0127 family)
VGISQKSRRVVTEIPNSQKSRKKNIKKSFQCFQCLPDFRDCVLLGLIIILAFIGSTVAAEEDKLPTTTIIFNSDLKIEAELAYTDETRMKGLMFRESLPEDAGMLFIFPYMDLHSFWMKNTLIGLDIIWLNDKKEIVYFTTAVPCTEDPCASYAPMQKAKYVLEVNEGFAKKHSLKMGTRLEFTIPPEISRKANQ